jgi:hypothetical protein
MKNLASHAGFHFFLPAFLRGSMADVPVHKPAQMTEFELPRWAVRFAFFGTFLEAPAIFPSSLQIRVFLGKNEQKLALNVHRHLSPPLLKALYGL